MTSNNHELIVIGGGAAGMGAARAARRTGARTLLIQEGPIGGECTFSGCVPSKTLLAAAARGDSFRDAMRRVRAAIEQIAATENDDAFRREGIDVLHGRARFTAAQELEVGGQQLRSTRIILATGSKPAVPSIEGLPSVPYLTNENVFELTDQPETLAIFGGGSTGCELAQAFQRLGTRVTLIEEVDRLLPREDPETSAVIREALEAEGVDVRLAQRVVRVEPTQQTAGCRLHLAGGSHIAAHAMLIAVGRTAATDGLDLGAARVTTDDRGFVRTDGHLATTAKGIWAAGDITGRRLFTHAADYMGRVAASNALSRFRRSRFDAAAIPWVTFTEPEVGSVGITEAQAAAHGARVAYLPMTEVDRAVTANATRGFVKLIAGPRPVLGNLAGGRILGATIVAERGGELADEVALAMRTRMFAGRLAQTVHAYPTWSWALQKAAAQFFFEFEGRAARPAQR